MTLTKEEKEILDAYEKGEFESVPDVEKKMAKYREYARNALQKIQKNK